MDGNPRPTYLAGRVTSNKQNAGRQGAGAEQGSVAGDKAQIKKENISSAWTSRSGECLLQ